MVYLLSNVATVVTSGPRGVEIVVTLGLRGVAGWQGPQLLVELNHVGDSSS